ncbi:hypothetical protein FQN57_003399 [Myotisia sp. PD_48]|nr:hypothetical protein FQN57_003399 [Myotisia sp. PD_48]
MTFSLKEFTKLNSQIYLYKSSCNEPLTKPCLIVICAWLFATPKHVDKYIQLYRTNLPHADILLIYSALGDMIWTTDSAQERHLDPAVQVIFHFIDSNQSPNYQLVIHAFSNAGSHAAVQLAEAFGKAHYPMPISALVLDSCPGSPSARLAANAIVLSLPKFFIARLFGSMLVYFVVGVVMILDMLNISENVISKTRRELNTSTFLSVPRVYLFSETDQMVPWHDIVLHAQSAQRIIGGDSGVNDPDGDFGGKSMVSMVRFSGSGHVQHIISAEEKYWKAIAHILAI